MQRTHLKFLVGWAVFVAALGLGPVQAAEGLPSADDVLRQLVERTRSDRAPASQGYYLCTKQTVTEELDSAGRVTNRKVKVGESHPNSSPAKDANKWSAQNGFNLDEELLRRYQFTVSDREMLNGRPTLVLVFVPRQPAPPIRRFQDRLLNRAMGTLWVDEQDHELIKAALSLSEAVSFGVIGAVDSLNFSFERSRTEDGNWLMKWTDTSFKGRKFVIPVQIRKRVDCRDFKRLNSPGEQSTLE